MAKLVLRTTRDLGWDLRDLRNGPFGEFLAAHCAGFLTEVFRTPAILEPAVHTNDQESPLSASNSGENGDWEKVHDSGCEAESMSVDGSEQSHDAEARSALTSEARNEVVTDAVLSAGGQVLSDLPSLLAGPQNGARTQEVMAESIDWDHIVKDWRQGGNWDGTLDYM